MKSSKIGKNVSVMQMLKSFKKKKKQEQLVTVLRSEGSEESGNEKNRDARCNCLDFPLRIQLQP